MHIRKLKSRNGNLQIQVVQKIGRQNKVVRHFGTARNDLEVNELVNIAKQFVQEQRIKSGKLSLFDNRYSTSEMAEISSIFCIRRVLDSVTYRFFYHFYQILDFDRIGNKDFADLVVYSRNSDLSFGMLRIPNIAEGQLELLNIDPSLPVYLRRQAQTGNPLFPLSGCKLE